MSRVAGFLAGLGVLCSAALIASGQELNPRELDFFEKKIRPVLVKHCYECHSAEAEELGGGLLLDTREGIRRGGDSGHAVVPGDLDESMLIGAIRFEGFEMPPENPLPENVVADFEKWVEMGAPDPRDGEAVWKAIDFEAARQYWAFRPVDAGQPPALDTDQWSRTDLDRFVFGRLNAEGLKPVGDATPRELVRRIYFDLIGIPPTPEQVEAFVSDSGPEAVARLVDDLLDSPQFGVRWGRHWLDVVRYGESTGMERNFTFPHAWRYRDYVIDSFNQDKPFDQFIVEQVAGDLLETDDVEQRNEHHIATGLLALGTKSLNETNREKFRMDVVDEQIDVTSQAFIALTVSCARCHDHKFDPIPTKDYYSMAGIFRSTDTFYGTGGVRGNRQAGKLLALDASGVHTVAVSTKGNANNNNATVKRIATQLRAANKRLEQFRKQAKKNAGAKKRLAATESQIQRLKAQLRRLKKEEDAPMPGTAGEDAILVMAVRDSSSPADTELRIRGEANDRGEPVPRGLLSVLAPEDLDIKAGESGRLQYAKWLASPENPLTARVAVNRIWQHLIGRGIVGSVNNFGVMGEEPTHPKLLDFMAQQFMDDGWSFKAAIRHVINSRVYQLSSRSDAAAEQIDPDNRLLWRMNQRRLEAEAIRDAMLFASGQLDLRPGEGSLVSTVGDGDIGRGIPPSRFATSDAKRSVYLPIVRGAVPEVLQVFDFPDPSIIYGQREVTTVPTQALFMMNSPFVSKQSRHFADRILAAPDLGDAERVDLAYRLALARPAEPAEVSAALAFLDTMPDGDEDESVDRWAGVCQALFACSEFRYID